MFNFTEENAKFVSNCLMVLAAMVAVVTIGLIKTAVQAKNAPQAYSNEWKGFIRFSEPAQPAPVSTAPSAVKAHPVPHTAQTSEMHRAALAIAARYRIAEAEAQRFVLLAKSAAKDTGLPPALILAVMARESSFQPSAFNRGDSGLMQVNPRWHPEKVAEVGGRQALFRPEINVMVGSRILKEYVEMSNGNIRQGLRRYNGIGKANNYPELVMNEMALISRWF